MRTLLVFLGVATAACTELPAITEAPRDGGTTLDGSTGEADAGTTPDAAQDAGLLSAESLCKGVPDTVPVNVGDFSVSCNQGWALVLRAASESAEFAYNGACWDPKKSCALDTLVTGTTAREARFPAYRRLSGTRVRIVMSDSTGKVLGSGEFPYAVAAATLGDAVIGAPFGGNSQSEPMNYMADAGAKLHPFLTAGVNVGSANAAQVRLGTVGAAAANKSPGSWLGIGGQLGSLCGGALTTITVGNGYVASCDATTTKGEWVGAFASVYVK